MAGSATNALEQLILPHALAIRAWTMPAQIFVGLCTDASVPDDATGGTEVAGGGYVRMQADFVQGVDPDTTTCFNGAEVLFPAATADWGNITHFELWNAAVAGTRLFWGALDVTRTVLTGDQARFPQSALSVVCD